MVGQNERFGLPVSASSATSSNRGFDRLARWAVALPAFSPSLAKQPGYRPPRLSIMCGKQDTSRESTACPTLAAVRPDFETFAETRVSRLH